MICKAQKIPVDLVDSSTRVQMQYGREIGTVLAIIEIWKIGRRE